MIESGNKIYFGVVESRADPLKLGRCKVRVVGIHTESTTLLPTSDLPWAYPVQPINSAAMSGIGYSPTGLVEGTWVVVAFRDEGSFQEPIIMGSLGGIPEEKEDLTDTGKSKVGSRYEGLSDVTLVEDRDKKPQDGYLVDSEGNVVTDSSGTPIRTGSAEDNVLDQTDATPTKPKEESGHELGKVSERFESGGRGPGTINDYRGKASGDYGGASYGKWQIASFRGANGEKKVSGATPMDSFLRGSKYKDEFAGMVPGTPAFDAKWREVAAKDPIGFESEQKEFISDNYYSPALNGARRSGYDLTSRGPAVQDALWSTSVQYGPGKTSRIIERTFGDEDISMLSDAEIVSRIQDNKLKNVENDFKKSPSLWGGLRNRIKSEKDALVGLAGDDGGDFTASEIESLKKKQKAHQEAEKGSEIDPDEVKAIPSSGVVPPTTPDGGGEDGFRDLFGVYPRKKWMNEPDVSRLARNEKIDQTIIKAKELTLVKRVGTAGGGEWNEPKSPYNAVYPLNHVHQTESGHVVEYDDSPDAERIHIYHRAGSFFEFHPDGTVVYKSVKDQFEITVNDRNVYVGGNCNITVVGDANIYSKGLMNIESDGDMTIKTKSNLRIGAEGTCHIESNRDMHVGSGGNYHEGANNILMNCSWQPSTVRAGDYYGGEIDVTTYDDDEPVPVPEAQEETAKKAAMNNNPDFDPSGPSAPPEDLGDIQKEKADDTPVELGEKVDPNTKIAKNTTVADLTTSPVLTKHKLRDQVGMTEEEIAGELSSTAKNVVEPLRDRYGSEFIVTSAFRHCEVGQKSQHCKGQAIDIQFPGLPADQAAARAEEIARSLPNGYDQMIVEYHGKNPVFHISYNQNGNRNEKLSTPDLNNYFSGFRDKRMNKMYG